MGLILAVVIVAAILAYLIGDRQGMLLAAIYYGVFVLTGVVLISVIALLMRSIRDLRSGSKEN